MTNAKPISVMFWVCVFLGVPIAHEKTLGPHTTRILFTVGNVDRDIGRYSGRYSGRHSVDSRSTLGR